MNEAFDVTEMRKYLIFVSTTTVIETHILWLFLHYIWYFFTLVDTTSLNNLPYNTG